MSDVKRYEPFGRDGLSSVMHEDDVGDYVRHDDYEAKRKGWIDQHSRDSAELRRLCEERDQLRAEAEQFRELAKANADALGKALAELEAIRGQGVLYVSAESLADDGVVGMHATRKQNAVQNVALYALPPQQPDAVSVPSDTALRRAAKFLAGIDNGCNEVKTLRTLVENAQGIGAVSVPRELLRRLLDSNNRNTFCAGTYLKAHDELSAILSTKNAEEV